MPTRKNPANPTCFADTYNLCGVGIKPIRAGIKCQSIFRHHNNKNSIGACPRLIPEYRMTNPCAFLIFRQAHIVVDFDSILRVKS